MSAQVYISGGRLIVAGGAMFGTGGAAPPPPPTPSMQIVKFVSGDFAMSESYNGTTSLAQAESDINILVANPSTAVGYAIGLRIGTIDANNTAGMAPSNPTGSQTTLLAQFPGVTLIGEIFNYLQSKLPGFHLHVFFWSETYGGTFSAAAITSSSLNNGGASGGGFYIPNYIWNCGGTVHVPSSYLSSTTTAYAVAPIYSGSSQYGLQFDGYNGTNLTSCGWQIWNPGLTQALINTEQAVFSVYQFTVTSGPLAGNTYTVDTCPLTHYGDLEEVSYNHNSNPSGVTVNPPLSAAGGLYPPSIANFVTGFKARLQGRQTNTSHTMFNDCVTFGYGAQGQGAQTAAQVAAMVNNNISGTGLSTIPNLAQACADTWALNWFAPSQGPLANQAMQGFVGIPNPVSTGTALPAPSVSSLTGVQDYWAVYEPIDYQANLPSGTASYSQAGVVAMAAGANNGHVAATRRFWCMGDNSTFGTIAWTTYVSQALPNCVACSSLVPTNIMAPPENFIAASTTSSSVTLTWSPQTTNTGTGLVYKIYRNGSLINTTANTSVATYTDSGLPANTTYTYTINLANANGAGPQATWVATTQVFNYQTFTGSTPVSSIVPTGSGISGGYAYLSALTTTDSHQAGALWNNAQVNIQSFTTNFTFTLPSWDNVVITAGSANITMPSTNNGLVNGNTVRFGGSFGSITGLDNSTVYTVSSVSSVGGTTTFSVGTAATGTGSCTVSLICMQGMTFSVQNSNATSNNNNAPYYGTGFTGDANMSGCSAYATSPTNVQEPLGNSINIGLMTGNGGAELISTAYAPTQAPNSTWLSVNGGSFNTLAMRNDLNSSGLDLRTGNILSGQVIYDGSYLDVTFMDTVTGAQARSIWPLSDLTSIVGGDTAWVGFTNGELTTANIYIRTWSYSTGYNVRLASPAFSVTPGQYTSAQTVSLSAAAGATIYYTTNGVSPTTSSTKYTSALTVSASQVIQAIAVQSGYTTSYPVVGAYQIASGGTPNINFPSGFATLGGQLLLNGCTYVNASNYLQLVYDVRSAGGTFKNGAVWTSVPQTISTFSTNFTFTSTGHGDSGFTFCLQNFNQSPTTYNTWKSGGWVSGGPTAMLDSLVVGSLGYAATIQPYAPAPNGQTVGFGAGACIAFDMSVGSNGGVGFYSGGVVPSGSTTSLTNLNLSSGNPITVAITYNGTTLTVGLTDTVTHGTQTLTFTKNITSLVGASTAYAGFTGASGYDGNVNIQVTEWTM
jgi:Chitobiase/beta-hexosaminidase C-terminal domain/Fibronectin type III domain